MNTTTHPHSTGHPEDDDFWGPDLSAAPRLPLILVGVCFLGALALLSVAPRSVENEASISTRAVAEAKPAAAPKTPPAAPASSPASMPGPAPAAVAREQVRQFQDLELRTWTDRSGKQVLAAMIGATPHSVTLATPEGKSRTLSRNAFSPADLAYVDWVLKPTQVGRPQPTPPSESRPVPASDIIRRGVPPPAISDGGSGIINRPITHPTEEPRTYAPSAARVAEYR